MADEFGLPTSTFVLLFWTVLAIVFGIFILWKCLKARKGNPQGRSTSKVSENVKKARLKYFAGKEANVSNNSEEVELSTKHHNVLEEETNQVEKETESVDAYRVTEALPPLVRYTKSIEGPSKSRSAGRSVTREYENSPFDPETSAPITRPLESLEDVLSWRQGSDFFNVATIQLSDQCRKSEKRPRTLVCHDMKGGYLEDRFVQGVNSTGCYMIYHWHLIDVFIYFSHHFITIPPPVWTNAAHTHGVPVLGTVITEKEEGAARCSEFLKDRESWQSLVNQLVDIAEYYKFDGWLLNIENPIQPVQVNNLEEFVKTLTTEMHQRIPNSFVIWYDSVTNKGDLEGQNELNSANRVFFDACDGIFLNYGWNEAHLMRSASAAGQDRQADVYVGVDVFGRGCFGGGGYNCNKALKVIRDEKLSAALFAPGWVMEILGSKDFFAHEDKFWDLLAPFCPEHAVVREMPLVTSLCRGCGNTASIDGKVVLSHPWTHLSTQQCQPTFDNTFFNLGPGLTITSVKHTMDEAYNGGSCLLIAGHVDSCQEVSKSFARLYKTNFQITGPLLLSFTFKLNPKQCLSVALQLQTDKVPTYLLLLPATSDQQDSSNTEDSDLNNKLIRRFGIAKSQTMTSSVFTSPIGGDHYRLFEPLTADSHATVQQAHGLKDENATTWCTRHYLIAEKGLVGHTVQEIRMVCSVSPGTDSTEPFKLYLGEIKIVDPQVVKLPLASVRNIRSVDVEWKSSEQEHLLSLTLMWDCPNSDGLVDAPAHYNIFRVTQDSSIFLGRAFVEAYRVCQIPVSKTCSSVEFIVQIVTRSGLKKRLGECSHFKLNW